MKQILTAIYIVLGLLTVQFMSGCYKDKGNYTYNMPDQPVATNLDTVYYVKVGDSLVIDPKVKIANNAPLRFAWRITVVSAAADGSSDVVDSSAVLRIIFGLGAQRFSGRLTIINPANGMQYFYNFVVSGQTDFAKGTTVLSSENGVTQVSFIKTDGTVQARLFGAVNPDVVLPEEPYQLVAVPQWSVPNTVETFWVLGKKGVNTGIQINANTFLKTKTLADNFFSAPDTIVPSTMFTNTLGIISGIINNKLNSGGINTWNLAPVYGMFAAGTPGDYELSPEIAIHYSVPTEPHAPTAYIGYDQKKKQFIRFKATGGDPLFFGTTYPVKGTAFDPTNVGMDLIRLLHVGDGLCYAYCRAADQTLYELKFQAQFIDPGPPMLFDAQVKRVFPRSDLVTATTKWEITADQVIFFTSGDKIYRYNPINDDFKALTTTFTGKTITMIKLINGGNTLVAGTAGSLYYLDVSTGSLGTLSKQIDGVPGNPIDLAVRQ